MAHIPGSTLGVGVVRVPIRPSVMRLIVRSAPTANLTATVSNPYIVGETRRLVTDELARRRRLKRPPGM